MTKFFGAVLSVVGGIGCLTIPTACLAGSVVNTTITNIAGTNYGGTAAIQPVFIYFTGMDANIGCNGSNSNAFAIDVGTPGGRAMYAAALTAQATGQTVSIYGNGKCDVWYVFETASSFVIK